MSRAVFAHPYNGAPVNVGDEVLGKTTLYYNNRIEKKANKALKRWTSWELLQQWGEDYQYYKVKWDGIT